MQREELFPVFAVGAERMVGVRALLTELVQLMPSAYEMEELHALTGAEGGGTVEIHADDGAPFAALVFKTHAEPHVGDVSYFRVLQGSAAAGQEVYNATRDTAEKLGHLAAPLGRERVEVTRLRAGDIACVAKLRNTHTNDTLSTREHPVRLPQVRFPSRWCTSPCGPRRATPRTSCTRACTGCTTRTRASPSPTTPRRTRRWWAGSASGTWSCTSRGCGASTAWRPSSRGPASPTARRSPPRTRRRGATRSRRAARGSSATRGCACRRCRAARATCSRTASWAGDPGQVRPAVDRGIQEAAARGVLAGFPLVDFQAELVDGSYHSVDSSEQAFRMAGILAFRAAAARCRPVLLEPLDLVEVTTPDAYLGDVLGDLSGRRGHILGTDAAGDDGAGAGGTRVRAVVPQAELHLYATALHSITHGRAAVARRFHGYEPVPGDAAQRVVAAEYAKRREDALTGA
jgi:elongation factor G